MSINKAFVIKNSLEVNQKLILADAISGKVGIGTSQPGYLLDVAGGIGATDVYVKNNLYTAGIGTVATLNSTSGTITTLNSTNGTITNLTGTLGTITTFNSTNGSITNLTGTSGTITTLNSTNGTITNLTGTLGTITTFNSTNGTITNLTGTAATIGTVKINSGIVTATSGIITYYGDGSYLTGNARNLTATIGLGTTGGVVGYGVSFIQFAGPGVSTVYYNGTTGIATVTITGGGSGSASIGIGSTPGDAFVGIITSGNLWYNTNLGRLFIYYQDVDSSQWVDAAPFNVGVITSLTNVSFASGSASSPSIYFVGDSQTGFFSPTPGQVTFVSIGSSVLNVNASGINVTGVATASSFVGNLTGTATGLSGTPNITVGTIAATSLNASGVVTATSFVGNVTGTATTATAAATAFGLSGTPNITVGTVTGNLTGNATGLSGNPSITVAAINNTGISTLTDLRLASIADKTTIVSGNSASLVYNTGGGNVAICTNPTGPITLNVTGIPTDSSFDNRAISFAVIVQQSTTAYGCSDVSLNGVVFNSRAAAGVQTAIAYVSGTVATASTTGYDVFNFTGINTVGSAASTLNYKLLSNVSGGYRRY